MNTNTNQLMLITNGARENLPALEYGAWLAEKLRLPVNLVGISENRKTRRTVEEALDSVHHKLHKLDIKSKKQLVQGDAFQMICQLANQPHNLVILGPLGRPNWKRWLRGSTFRRIIHTIPSPVIYAPVPRMQMEHILVCMGGLGYAHSVENQAIFLARHFKARLTILHIVARVQYEYPTAVQVHTHWEEILNTDTPQGHNLRLALQKAQQAGISAELMVHQGDIIHEIISEISRNTYDLIAMGSKASSESLRSLFTPDVTAEVAKSVSIPVLTTHLEERQMR